ncbi:hypothetical protein B0H16DRAFT_1466766 [Mycena metata]|uniref:Uncharacterized protein n=1 Tax=Mycena metata TaxID=1033252 RepID=A0AAD7I6Q2_9AGAR|nr:hypothetical protein B0H16DRAFT_1466766 [Mycena metata]
MAEGTYPFFLLAKMFLFVKNRVARRATRTVAVARAGHGDVGGTNGCPPWYNHGLLATSSQRTTGSRIHICWVIYRQEYKQYKRMSVLSTREEPGAEALSLGRGSGFEITFEEDRIAAQRVVNTSLAFALFPASSSNHTERSTLGGLWRWWSRTSVSLPLSQPVTPYARTQ